MDKIQIYLEVGKKRTFAGAIDWPGWCRSGRDESSALQALCDYARRYARTIQTAQLGFDAPLDPSGLRVVERLEGDATTDFGTPGTPPSADAAPLQESDLQRFQRLLEAGWKALDAASEAAAGKELRKGPRGGGRELTRILEHVLNAEAAYLNRLGWKYKVETEDDPQAGLRQVRKAFPQALAAGARGELPSQGPRGGKMWTPRYYVRRSAWHILDHAWEIEDRIK
jgi:hypothetical protein